MNLGGSRILLIGTIFLVVSSSNAVAKNKHCVVASNRINDNFIAVTQDSLLHLSTTIDGDPGKLLYVLPRSELTKDKPLGRFYYAESMTADCETFSLNLYDDDRNTALLIIRSAPQMPGSGCKDEEHCKESFDGIIEWYQKGEYQPTHEKIRFKPTSSARLQGLDTGIPISEVEQFIAKTTYAVCSRVLAGDSDFEHSDIFHQCLAGFSGQTYVDELKKSGRMR